MTPSNELLRWLAQALIVTREREGLQPIDVAYHAHISPGTVDRWERGEHWPRDLDTALATYAKLAGAASPRNIVELALQLWREHDDAETPTQRAQDAARRAATHTKKSRGGSRGAPIATPKKQGAS